ncbi:hypothetical protein NHX12_030549, partial [Muraenolepis orangiensis]
MSVDLTLFPLDTVKTRLQSQQGFHKAGGFKGIYAGVPSAAVGSFPNAAAFFVTYDCTKSLLGGGGPAGRMAPANHMLAASLGEVHQALDSANILRGKSGLKTYVEQPNLFHQALSVAHSEARPLQGQGVSKERNHTISGEEPGQKRDGTPRQFPPQSVPRSSPCATAAAGAPIKNVYDDGPSPPPAFVAASLIASLTAAFQCHRLDANLEPVACLIRVPTEVVKQRCQASPTCTTHQGVRGLYRGYRSTVLRE